MTFYRLYRRKIKLMERREEGGLTETGKEKARKQEILSKLMRQFYHRMIKKGLNELRTHRGIFRFVIFYGSINLSESRD